MSGLSDGQLAQLLLVTRISAALGALGSLAVSYVYLFRSRWDIPLARVIFYMSQGFLVAAVARIVGTSAILDPTSTVCQVSGLFVQIADIYCVFWMLFIAIGLLLVTFFSWSAERARDWDRRFLLWSVILSFSFSLWGMWYKELGMIDPIYGSVSTWCWISPKHPTVQIVLMHGLALAVICFDTVVFLCVGFRLYRRGLDMRTESTMLKNAMIAYIQNAFIYLIFFLATWIPGWVARLDTLINGGVDSFAYTMIRSILNPSRGLLAFVLYWYLVARSNKSRRAPGHARL